MNAVKDDTLVKTSVCDDGPAREPAEDLLGIGEYVYAIADFLIHSETKTPLTMSVEGEWGSGKTSFLHQLKHVIEANGQRTVFFNAWRHDKDESLWAAFALECIKEVRRPRQSFTLLSFIRRSLGDVQLMMDRFDWNAAAPDIAVLIVRLIAFAVIIGGSLLALKVGGLQHLVNSNTRQIFLSLVGLSGVAASIPLFLRALAKAKEIVGDPFEVQLRKYVRDPEYRSRVSFVETFHKDFQNVITRYVEKGEKLFLFIDDLDRCDAARTADLVQAINMLTSTNVSGPVFILGMDRRFVAAALAARYQPLMSYLYPKDALEGDGSRRAGAPIDYGYAFIDKFVQLPFRLPRARPEYLRNLLGSTTASQKIRRARQSQTDSPRAQQIIEEAAKLLDFNPRRIKQFINVFRLNVCIFVITERIKNVEIAPQQLPSLGELTIEKLGIFLAIIFRWPTMVDLLQDDPTLLSRLQKEALKPSIDGTFKIPNSIDRNDVLAFLRKIENAIFRSADYSPFDRRRIFSLEAVDVNELLDIAPAARTQADRPNRGAEAGPAVAGCLLNAMGIPALICNDMPWNRGQLELVAPLASGMLAHYRFLTGAGSWEGVRIFGYPSHTYDGATLMQSRYNDGNLELVARSISDSRMYVFYHNSSDGSTWESPSLLDYAASGTPRLLQSRLSGDGNFELVAPRASGGLEHFWRNNMLSHRPWMAEPPFAQAFHDIEVISMFENIHENVSDLLVFARFKGQLYTVERINYYWGNLIRMRCAPDATKLPSIIASLGGDDRYDVFMPDRDGVGHGIYDHKAQTWQNVSLIGSGVDQVDAVAAVGDSSRYDVVMRRGPQLFHVWKKAEMNEWSSPATISS